MSNAAQLSERSTLTVLVVEDEWLVAEDLKGDLEGRGCTVLGPALSCKDALGIMADHSVDIAFIDTQLGDETCEAVLEECKRQGVAVFIFTGHAEHDLPEFARGYDLLLKPHNAAGVDDALARASRPSPPEPVE
jgi:DNA-binding LytR/AlgR family response regulator